MRRIWKILRRIGLALLILAAATYVADDLWARYRGRPVEHIKVGRYYVVENRWNETEYSVGSPFIQTCVEALLPHFGYVPCWYLHRHTIQEVRP